MKFDTKHMVGSTVSTTNNESTALFRRTKMPPSDLIEADESKAQVRQSKAQVILSKAQVKTI